MRASIARRSPLPPAFESAPPDDPARLLYELVSIPSVSRQEGEAASFLAARLAAFGLDAEVDAAGNVVGRLEPRSGSRILDVMLLGHIDTVPGGPEVALRGGAIYGRGAVDAKGPLAVFAAVAARLARRRPEGVRLTVVGAVEEEISSSKGARFIAATHPRPDLCVIGEPSGTTAVTLGYKGRLLVDLERRRETCHSAGPEPTATAEIVELWRRVDDLAAGWNVGRQGIFARLQTELQSIRSAPRDGDVSSCRATFGFRLPPGLPPADLEARLEALCSDFGRGFDARFYGGEPAWVGERRSGLVHAFTGAIRTVAGARPRLVHKTGTSDMNVVGPIWRVPILAYGPGESRLDHTPHEHVDVGHVRLAADVLDAALESARSRWARDPETRSRQR